MIFYEAPHKLAATLRDLSDAFGPERPVSLCRELSKLHEEVRRTTLGEAADYYRDNAPKGEFVLGSPGKSRRPAWRTALPWWKSSGQRRGFPSGTE